MKESRFRAWHIKEKRMYQPNYLHFAPNGKLFGILVNEGQLLDANEFELLQFTGLVDNRGKDIYEGDVLKADWHDTRYPVHTIGPVQWDGKNARWDVGEGGCPQVDAQYHFEVIGNIYETPELAKEAV